MLEKFPVTDTDINQVIKYRPGCVKSGLFNPSAHRSVPSQVDEI